MKNPKTRFERLLKKEPSKKPRKKKDDNWWEHEARLLAAFPFEIETETTQDQDVGEEPIVTVTKSVPRPSIHTIVQITIDHGMQQAYITGLVEAVRQLEVMQDIVLAHSKSEALHFEIRRFIKEFKDNIASGRKHV